MSEYNPRKIISVGGSIIIPKTGFDIIFLSQFKNFITERILQGERFILVIGGGGTARNYQSAGKSVDDSLTEEDLDWIGIHATIINAQFMRIIFGELAHSEIITDPTRFIDTDKPIIFAAGWKPGRSTDHTAVTMASTFGVREILNLSNIECVYDKDPNMYSDAVCIEKMDWRKFRHDIVGYDWEPGKSAPFDPIASALAEELGLSVAILKGTDLDTVGRALSGESFRGTVISSSV
jgi:uridylate kinase